MGQASMAMDTARTVFGIVGNCTSAVIYLAPMSTFVAIKKNGSVGRVSLLPYLAALLSCAVWVLYALPMVHANNWPVLVISATGVFIELLYVAVFVYYATGLVRRIVCIGLVCESILVALVAVLVLFVVRSNEARSTLSGVLAVISSSAMYMSPFSAVCKVCRYGDVKDMDLYLSLSMLANSICWIIYAFLPPVDLFILIPMSIGLLCAVVQVFVYTIFNIFKDDWIGNIEIELV